MKHTPLRGLLCLLAALILTVALRQASTAETVTPPSVPLTAMPAWTSVTWSRPADDMAMVYVPEGEFLMGSTEAQVEEAFQACKEVSPGCRREWFEAEMPQHTVFLDAYWIDATEVTNRQFEQFAQETGYRTEAEEAGSAWVCVESDGGCEDVAGADWQHPQGPDTSISETMDHPVLQVSWNDAKAYCEWAGGRLPTEAEWEKAARGTDGRVYPWGNEFDGSRLNFCDKNCIYDWRDETADDGYEWTAPVGSYAAGASPYEALDMAGNVLEWVADRYAADYYGSSPASNPQGPESGESRGLRGGSTINNRYNVRVAGRSGRIPTGTSSYLGFRCVASTSPQSGS